MSNIFINTVALLDSITTERIQKIMNELSDISENRRALRFPPHFTIRYRHEIPEDTLYLLINDIKKVLTTMQFPIQFTGDKVTYTPWNAVYLDFDIPKSLQTLHEQIMEIGQRYRTDYIDESLLKEPSHNEKQKEYILKYGYHQAFEFFSPHITLAGGKISPDKMDLVKAYKIELPIVGKIEKIAFYKSDSDDSWTQCAVI